MARRILVKEQDVLVYKGIEIDQNVLDAVIDTDKRLLWAFIKNKDGDVQATAYTESEVIWMAESDVLREQDVEL